MLITRSFKTLSIKVFIFLSGCFIFVCGADKSAEWKIVSGYSFRQLNIPKNGQPGFSQVSTNQTAVVFTNLLSKKRYTNNQIYLNGSGVAAGDYDGDGNEDIFLAQNFFDVDSETSRYDAGLGQLVLGDGKCGFKAISGKQSGIGVFGQSRGSVASDFNGDGRVDIATTQNNDSIKLYFNQTAYPGIRVILKGKNSNHLCVGTTIMLESDGVKGPKREIRIGGGYLSQDSLTQIFPSNDKEAKFHVKWNDLESAIYSIPNNAKTIIISQTDGLRVAN